MNTIPPDFIPDFTLTSTACEISTKNTKIQMVNNTKYTSYDTRFYSNSTLLFNLKCEISTFKVEASRIVIGMTDGSIYYYTNCDGNWVEQNNFSVGLSEISNVEFYGESLFITNKDSLFVFDTVTERILESVCVESVIIGFGIFEGSVKSIFKDNSNAVGMDNSSNTVGMDNSGNAVGTSNSGNGVKINDSNNVATGEENNTCVYIVLTCINKSSLFYDLKLSPIGRIITNAPILKIEPLKTNFLLFSKTGEISEFHDGREVLIVKTGKPVQIKRVEDEFYILAKNGVYKYTCLNGNLKKIGSYSGFHSFDVCGNNLILANENNRILEIDIKSGAKTEVCCHESEIIKVMGPYKNDVVVSLSPLTCVLWKVKDYNLELIRKITLKNESFTFTVVDDNILMGDGKGISFYSVVNGENVYNLECGETKFIEKSEEQIILGSGKKVKLIRLAKSNGGVATKENDGAKKEECRVKKEDGRMRKGNEGRSKKDTNATNDTVVTNDTIVTNDTVVTKDTSATKDNIVTKDTSVAKKAKKTEEITYLIDAIRHGSSKSYEFKDEISYVKFSPDTSKIGVSLLDSRIYIFNFNLELILTLYGHSLPVYTFSFSPDSKMILTSSLDKLTKKWGLDFGECLKTYHVHSTDTLFLTKDLILCGSSKSIEYFKKGDKLKKFQTPCKFLVQGEDYLVVTGDYSLSILKMDEKEMLPTSSFEIDDGISKKIDVCNLNQLDTFLDLLDKNDSEKLYKFLSKIDMSELDKYISALDSASVFKLVDLLSIWSNKGNLVVTLRIFKEIIGIHKGLMKGNKTIYGVYLRIMERMKVVREKIEKRNGLAYK